MVSLDVALAYRRRGWSVIPLKRTNGKPDERKKSKGAWTAFQNALPVERMIEKWFGTRNEYGVAVVLGDVSGSLVCRDFDKLQAYQNWSASFPELARMLPTVETGDSGRHVYCRSEFPIGELRKRGELPDNAYFDLGDGECRVDRCYCALPPTMHPNGRRYSWLNSPEQGIPQIDFLGAGFRKPWDVTEKDREDQRRQKSTECHREGEERVPLPAIIETSNFASKCTSSGEFSPLAIESINPASTLGLRIESVILETLPKREGERNNKIFELARTLKAIPEFADAQANNLKEIVRQWHTQALPVIGTKPFDLTWSEFIHGWKRVKFPKGQEPMIQIVARARALPLPPEAEQYESEASRRLVSICRELARSSTSGIFFLSVRSAGELINVSPMHASRLFEMMEADGVLAVVELGSNKTQKATRFRYLGTR